MRYKKHAHCVYGLNYHIVLVTKYRRKIIDDEISDFLKKELCRLIEKQGGAVIEVETDLDHIHILAEIGPCTTLTEVVRILKTATARLIRNNFKEKISAQLWGDSFWSDSYFIASSGGVTLETLKEYVSEQGKPKKRGRPFANSSPLKHSV